MGALIPFTRNYTDVSTYEGYQFEFCCQRCGNGFRSAFRHSVTGFGGRIAELGGSLLGGQLGSTMQQVGSYAQWGRSSTRGSTNDQRLAEAAQDVAGNFVQCRGCAEWVCRGFCWNEAAGQCARCAPQQRVMLQHPGRTTGPAVGPVGGPGSGSVGGPAGGAGGGHCPNCGSQVSGRFCGDCGCPVSPRACSGCGTADQGTPFCQSCGMRMR